MDVSPAEAEPMKLRPLVRQPVVPADGLAVAHLQPKSGSSKAPPAQEQVSKLAQDAFISRTYELNNPANMGQGLDGAIRSASAVANDLEGLAQPNLAVGTGVALAGKLIKDATGVAVHSGRVISGFQQAHIGLVRTTGGYHAAATAVTSSLHKATKNVQPLLTRVERVGAIGSLGMAAVALPALTASAVRRNTKAVMTMADGTSTSGQRIAALKDAAYTDAALIYTTAAVPAAIKTLATTGAAKSFATRMATSAQKTGAYRATGKAAKVMTPVADATLLVADGLHLYTTMTSPAARGSAKARAALNVGLDALKLGLYACPRTRAVQLAYTAAGVTQFAFAVHGLLRPNSR
jgi:hypothetical protein